MCVLALGEDRRRHGRFLFLHIGHRLDFDHDPVERVAVPRGRFGPVGSPVGSEKERKGSAFEADFGARWVGGRRSAGGTRAAPEQRGAFVPCEGKEWVNSEGERRMQSCRCTNLCFQIRSHCRAAERSRFRRTRRGGE